MLTFTINELINNEMATVKFESDLNILYNWCITWGLVIN